MTLTLNESGVRKAAILLVQLGQEGAAKLLTMLPEHEVEAISGRILELESLEAAESESVLSEFRDLATARSRS